EAPIEIGAGNEHGWHRAVDDRPIGDAALVQVGLGLRMEDQGQEQDEDDEELTLEAQARVHNPGAVPDPREYPHCRRRLRLTAPECVASRLETTTTRAPMRRQALFGAASV